MENNNNNNDSISKAIKDYFNNIRLNTAQAIRKHDWSTVIWNVAFVLVIALIAVALSVLVLALVGGVLNTLLGKIFATPLLVYIGLLLLRHYLLTEQKKRLTPPPLPSPEEEHDLVRDATFLVLRDVTEYTPNLVSPSRPSAIECPDNPYTIEDGYIVHNFLDKICGPVDLDQLKIDIQRTFRQKHRAHELNGFSRDYVEINGSYYCPLQIFGKPQDFGDFIQISVVLATETTVKLTRAHKLLNLDNIGRTRGSRGATLTDDEI